MVAMADRPTPQDPQPEQTPEQAVPPPTGATEPLPPAHPAGAPQPGPATGYGVPAGPREPSHPRRWWGEATASTGSRIALVTAAALVVLVLVAGAGLVGSFVLHRVQRAVSASASEDHGVWGDDGERGGSTPFGNNGRGNGNGRKDGGQGGSDRGPGNGNGPGRGNGLGQGNGPGQGNGRAQGQGNGLGGGMLPGLGAVLHGEFTTTVTGRPAVMLFQVGEVTAVTEGASLTVRSTDGFKATYTLDTATSTVGGSPVTGDQVRVVAAKQGNTAVLVQTVGQGS